MYGRLLPAIFLVACTGAISDPGASNGSDGDGGGTAGSKGHGGSAAGHAGGVVVDGGHGGGAALACANSSSPDPGVASLVRLTTVQLGNTLADLFPGVTLPKANLPAETAANGFVNNVQAQASTIDYVSALESHALAVADAAVKSGTVLPCKPANAAQEDACAATFVDAFGKRAFRRPLTADERGRLVALYGKAKPTQGFAGAVTTLIAAMLQAPQFVYRPELPPAGAQGRVALSPYDVASRLSYLLWDSMPDAELMMAADAAKLGSPDDVRKQAMRLLQSPRAHGAVANFHAQWLKLQALQRRIDAKDVKAYPAFDASVATALEQSVERYVDDVFWGSGKLGDLLTSPKSFVNAKLAPIAGTSSNATELTKVDLDPRQRGGLLTQPGVMAGLAYPNEGAPVQRGVFVLDWLMCSPPPPPPPNVNTSLAPIPNGQKQTLRQRMEATHELGSCKGCHQIIDGVGFGFEHYDFMGRYRTTDDTLPVDATVKIIGSRDFDGTYADAVELSKKLAGSGQVAECVVRQWFSYALERANTDDDGCFIGPLTDRFVASGGDLRALVVDLVGSDAFRFRRAAD